MTLKELSEHPELASEDDLKSFNQALKIFKEFGEQIKYTFEGVTEDRGRSQEEIAKSYYEETMLLSAIMESFVYRPEQEYKDINKFVFNYTVKEFFWEVSVPKYQLCLLKLTTMGLLGVTKEDKINPSFAITEDGYSALKQQTYSNLAQSALFNLQSQQINDKMLALSKMAVKQNKMMLAVAVASAVVAIVSVVVAIIGGK